MHELTKSDMLLQKEEAERKAQEEAERKERERAEKARKEEEERLERKKVGHQTYVHVPFNMYDKTTN